MINPELIEDLQSRMKINKAAIGMRREAVNYTEQSKDKKLAWLQMEGHVVDEALRYAEEIDIKEQQLQSCLTVLDLLDKVRGWTMLEDQR